MTDALEKAHREVLRQMSTRDGLSEAFSRYVALVRIDEQRKVADRLAEAKRKRNEEMYPYYPDNWEYEDNTWDQAIEIASPLWQLLGEHDWDELLFGGFFCMKCTPEDSDDPDETVMWPCPPLLVAGLTLEKAEDMIRLARDMAKAMPKILESKRREQS
jgi:hypothetical protein